MFNEDIAYGAISDISYMSEFNPAPSLVSTTCLGAG